MIQPPRPAVEPEPVTGANDAPHDEAPSTAPAAAADDSMGVVIHLPFAHALPRDVAGTGEAPDRSLPPPALDVSRDGPMEPEDAPAEAAEELPPHGDVTEPRYPEHVASPPPEPLAHAQAEHAEPEADPGPANFSGVSPILSALDAADLAAGATAAQPPSLHEAPGFEAGASFEAEPLQAYITSPERDPDDEQGAAAPEQPELPLGDEHDRGAPGQDAAEAQTAPPANDDLQKQRAEILQDAAARIAAEASATAAALENLKRLLVHKLPEPGVAAPPPPLPETHADLAEPPPIPAYRPPVQVPITPPPMMPAAAALPLLPDEEALPQGRPRAAVGSFFAGFALSWVFGAVLYVFLTAG